MLSEKEQEIVNEGKYIIEREATLRAAAKQFGCSKSKIHYDVTKKLYEINPILSGLVADILRKNKRFATSRGGQATKNKWLAIKQN